MRRTVFCCRDGRVSDKQDGRVVYEVIEPLGKIFTLCFSECVCMFHLNIYTSREYVNHEGFFCVSYVS